MVDDLTRFYNVSRPLRISAELNRGRVTAVALAGRIGPIMDIRSRSAGAKVSKFSTRLILSSPLTKTEFIAAFGNSFLSSQLLQGEITVGLPSGKRSAATANETAYAACTVDGFFSESQLQCTVHPQYLTRVADEDTIIWAQGSVSLALAAPAFGWNATLFVGDVVTALSVDENTGGKIAFAQGTRVDIRGSFFAEGAFAATDNAVLLSLGLSSATAVCNVVFATNSTIQCFISAGLSPGIGASVYARVTTWGYSQLAYIGRVVPKPSISIKGDSLVSGETSILLNGTNLADDLGSVQVRLYKGNADVNPAYVYCDVNLDSSTANQVVCKLPNTSLVSTPGDRVTVSIYSNGAWSNDYTVSVVANPGAPFSASPLDASVVGQNNTIGLAVGLSVAALAIILAIVLGIFLFRRQRRLTDIEGEMHQVPAAFASMFNIKSSDLTIVKRLGEGSFGAVFLAEFKTSKGTIKQVAVKKLTSSMLAAAVDGFFREAVRFHS
jgi:hypothetical protein